MSTQEQKRYKTMRRDVLRRKIEKGEVIGKRLCSYTDDYAYDNSINHGNTIEWLPVKISGLFTCFTDFISLPIRYFENDNSRATLDTEEGTISLHIHSNTCYKLKFIK